MAVHEVDMEMYQRSKKDVEFLKALKRQMGQSSASTVEGGPESEDEDQDGKATRSALKDQAGHNGAERSGPSPSSGLGAYSLVCLFYFVVVTCKLDFEQNLLLIK